MRTIESLSKEELARIVGLIHDRMYYELDIDRNLEIYAPKKEVDGGDMVDLVGALFEEHGIACVDEEPYILNGPIPNVLRYIVYNFDSGELLSKCLFETTSEAADATDYLDDTLILPVVLPGKLPNTEESVADEPDAVDLGDQAVPAANSTLAPVHPCECELPGYFHSGVPGVLARVEAGRVVNDAHVERCDACDRFPNDEAARAELHRRGMV